MNEADTCRKFVVPKLQHAGWEDRPHAINEQRTFTDGRIVFIGGKARRGKQKRADYILRYRPDFPIAVVEAKSRYRHAADGLQQAKDYAEILGLKFAYRPTALRSSSSTTPPASSGRSASSQGPSICGRACVGRTVSMMMRSLSAC